MKTNKETERRKGPDNWIQVIRTASILSWLSFLAALIFFHYARPERDTGIVRYYGISIRKDWLSPWTEWLELVLILCAVLSIFSLVFGSTRNRRKEDSGYYSLFILLLVSLGWLAYFWI